MSDGIQYNQTYTKRTLESIRFEKSGSVNSGLFPGQSDNLQVNIKYPFVKDSMDNFNKLTGVLSAISLANDPTTYSLYELYKDYRYGELYTEYSTEVFNILRELASELGNDIEVNISYIGSNGNLLIEIESPTEKYILDPFNRPLSLNSDYKQAYKVKTNDSVEHFTQQLRQGIKNRIENRRNLRSFEKQVETMKGNPLQMPQNYYDKNNFGGAGSGGGGSIQNPKTKRLMMIC